MNSEIRIVDNFLNEEDYEEINDGNISWIVQTSSTDCNCEFLYSEVDDIPFFSTYLLDKVIEELDSGGYSMDKIYFNGHWNGREGTLHYDPCDITALLYTGTYEYGWGGFTEIMTEPEPTLIHPIPNRLVIFPGNIHHKAYSFAYQDCPLRVTLAFKINKGGMRIKL